MITEKHILLIFIPILLKGFADVPVNQGKSISLG